MKEAPPFSTPQALRAAQSFSLLLCLFLLLGMALLDTSRYPSELCSAVKRRLPFAARVSRQQKVAGRAGS